MNSIDNLRENVLTAPSICSTTRAILVGYIDGIEREGMEERTAAYNKGHDEGFDLGFVSADDWFAEHEDAMAEHGWVRLPVDADGVPIHVGDVMEWPNCSTAEVVGIGNDTFFFVEDGEDAADWSRASDKIHHHAPTVEDVLREFYVYAERGKEHHREDVDDAVLAEFAAKLRLAGDGE